MSTLKPRAARHANAKESADPAESLLIDTLLRNEWRLHRVVNSRERGYRRARIEAGNILHSAPPNSDQS
jgi:hypothetical protein